MPHFVGQLVSLGGSIASFNETDTLPHSIVRAKPARRYCADFVVRNAPDLSCGHAKLAAGKSDAFLSVMQAAPVAPSLTRAVCTTRGTPTL
jgi:hypothetical protein